MVIIILLPVYNLLNLPGFYLFPFQREYLSSDTYFDGKYIYTHVLVNSGEVNIYRVDEILDPPSLQFLGSNYYKDKYHIYVNQGLKGFRIVKDPNIDLDSFSYITEHYFKDKTNIYYGDKNLNADHASFEYLVDDYAKDANSIYYNGEKITGSDGSTFVVLPVDRRSTYAKDKNNVYWDGKKSVADSKTLIVFEDTTFAMDKDNVYWVGKVLENAGRSTFKIVKAGSDIAEDQFAFYNSQDRWPKDDCDEQCKEMFKKYGLEIN